MAQRVDTFDFGRHRGGAPRKYPWEEWLDGSIWELTHGKDFEPAPRVFRTMAYTRARDHGVSLRTHIGDGVVVLQAVKRS